MQGEDDEEDDDEDDDDEEEDDEEDDYDMKEEKKKEKRRRRRRHATRRQPYSRGRQSERSPLSASRFRRSSQASILGVPFSVSVPPFIKMMTGYTKNMFEKHTSRMLSMSCNITSDHHL